MSLMCTSADEAQYAPQECLSDREARPVGAGGAHGRRLGRDVFGGDPPPRRGYCTTFGVSMKAALPVSMSGTGLVLVESACRS
jgi:hypothetical protein